MGTIYKITNTLNNHVYIGQTIYSLEKRWKNHINASYREDKECNLPLHRAIRKYGEENFLVEVIEECLDEELDNREIYWINFYNSYKSKDHYNASPGGAGSHGHKFDYDQLAKEYEKIKSLAKVANKYGCSVETVRNACKNKNVKILSCKQQSLKKATKVKCIELNLIFDSMHDAGRWLQLNGYTKSYKAAATGLCLHINGKQKSVYGLHWKKVI